MVLGVLRQPLAPSNPLGQLRVGDIAGHDQGAGQRQSGPNRVLGKLRTNLIHRSVEVDGNDILAQLVLPYLGDELGWVGFDISNAISPDSRYVRVATGLDYREAAPVSGMRFGAASESLDVSIQVQQQ